MDIRKGTVSFKKDVVFGSEFDQFFVVMIVVRVEEDLLQVKPPYPGSDKKMPTWFTAGVTFAVFNNSRRWWTVELLTPMLL